MNVDVFVPSLPSLDFLYDFKHEHFYIFCNAHSAAMRAYIPWFIIEPDDIIIPFECKNISEVYPIV